MHHREKIHELVRPLLLDPLLYGNANVTGECPVIADYVSMQLLTNAHPEGLRITTALVTNPEHQLSYNHPYIHGKKASLDGLPVFFGERMWIGHGEVMGLESISVYKPSQSYLDFLAQDKATIDEQLQNYPETLSILHAFAYYLSGLPGNAGKSDQELYGMAFGKLETLFYKEKEHWRFHVAACVELEGEHYVIDFDTTNPLDGSHVFTFHEWDAHHRDLTQSDTSTYLWNGKKFAHALGNETSLKGLTADAKPKWITCPSEKHDELCTHLRTQLEIGQVFNYLLEMANHPSCELTSTGGFVRR